MSSLAKRSSDWWGARHKIYIMAGVIVWGHVEYHGNGPCSCLKLEAVCFFCNVHVGEEGTCYCFSAGGEFLAFLNFSLSSSLSTAALKTTSRSLWSSVWFLEFKVAIAFLFYLLLLCVFEYINDVCACSSCAIVCVCRSGDNLVESNLFYLCPSSGSLA